MLFDTSSVQQYSFYPRILKLKRSFTVNNLTIDSFMCLTLLGLVKEAGRNDSKKRVSEAENEKYLNPFKCSLNLQRLISFCDKKFKISFYCKQIIHCSYEYVFEKQENPSVAQCY